MVTGRCECGSVVFSLPEVRDSVTVCHCSQCRRTSGHLWASTVAPAASISFQSENGLTWYTSSAQAERGFCANCGSSLFYRIHGDEKLAIAAGCIDEPNRLTLGKHIYTSSKAAYYDLPDDGLPRLDT